jgi:hypothetical protein
MATDRCRTRVSTEPFDRVDKLLNQRHHFITSRQQHTPSDRWDVRKRETLVTFVSIVGNPCVVEPRDEHYNAQHHEENS